MDRFWSFVDSVAPFVPPALGAFVGLRYAESQGARDRAVAWFCSAMIGIYTGPMIGEHFELGGKTTVGMSFLIAMFGAELVAVVVRALRQWSDDPVGTFARWRDAIMGRKP